MPVAELIQNTGLTVILVNQQLVKSNISLSERVSEPEQAEQLTSESIPTVSDSVPLRGTEPMTRPSFSSKDLEEWIDNQENAAGLAKSKIIDLTKPRKNSYLDSLLDPTRPDIRDGLSEQKIRTSQGDIYVVKIRGEQYCYWGKTPWARFRCGDIEQKNPLVTEYGDLKNSGQEHWKYED